MYAMSTNTSTDTWVNSGWAISPGHALNVVDVPPPPASHGLVPDLFQSEPPLGGDLRVLDLDEYLELLEDVTEAQKAAEEYGARGIEGTIAYSEYRDKRLGSES